MTGERVDEEWCAQRSEIENGHKKKSSTCSLLARFDQSWSQGTYPGSSARTRVMLCTGTSVQAPPHRKTVGGQSLVLSAHPGLHFRGNLPQATRHQRALNSRDAQVLNLADDQSECRFKTTSNRNEQQHLSRQLLLQLSRRSPVASITESSFVSARRENPSRAIYTPTKTLKMSTRQAAL